MESIYIRSNTPTTKQGRGSLSAFFHMDTSDLHPQTRVGRGGGGGGLYRVTLCAYHNITWSILTSLSYLFIHYIEAFKWEPLTVKVPLIRCYVNSQVK